MPNVAIKWKGQHVKTINIASGTTLMAVKSELKDCTGVEAANQKLLFKGKILKQDQEDFSGINLVEGDVIMMMGTPSTTIQRVESAASAAVAQDNNSAGGDAEQIPDNRTEPTGLVNLGNTCYMNASLQTLYAVTEVRTLLQEKAGTSTSAPFVKNVSDLLQQLKKRPEPIIPLMVLSSLHKRFPHFAEKTEQGIPAQQDAEECWSLVLNELATVVPEIGNLFTGELETCISNKESGEETKSREPFVKLNCHIAQDTLDLVDGIKAGLKETLVKYSDRLGKDAEFAKTSKISEFPPYLMVNFVRFFWKPKEQIKAKILKKVKYPTSLDLSQIATADAQKPQYELISVLTHIGRSADSGHYISWTKDPETSLWWKFNDDKVSNVTEDDIKKLDGGGDWHIAYLCLYRRL